MNIPSTLNSFLREMEFPATKEDLLREARRDGLPLADRIALEDLPDQSFSARWHIRYLLARRAAREPATAAA